MGDFLAVQQTVVVTSYRRQIFMTMGLMELKTIDFTPISLASNVR